MTSFSASDAALEGFHLIRRRWRVVLGWAGFNLLALIMVLVLSAVLSVVAAALGGGAKSPALALVGLVVLLSTLFAQAIIAAGVLRLEMRPEEPAFMHLRLGRDEARLVLIWLITVTGAWVIAGWLAPLIAHAAGRGGVWIELASIVLVIYLALRFALIGPVSLAERRIDFPRSWRLTRGRTLALLGMSALSFCLIGLMMVTVLLALAGIALAAGGLDALSSLFTGGREALQSHPAVFLLAFAVEIILTPVLWVLAMSPAVAAYRAFSAPAEETGGV